MTDRTWARWLYGGKSIEVGYEDDGEAYLIVCDENGNAWINEDSPTTEQMMRAMFQLKDWEQGNDVNHFKLDRE